MASSSLKPIMRRSLLISRSLSFNRHQTKPLSMMSSQFVKWRNIKLSSARDYSSQRNCGLSFSSHAIQNTNADIDTDPADFLNQISSSNVKNSLASKVTRASYYNGDEELRNKVTIVRTREEARNAIEALYRATEQGAIHGCDTEVMDIDLKLVGPIGNGKVTCISIYSGPMVDYGDGVGKSLWVDNLDEAAGVLMEFRDWFEDESQKKIWHNYGFDRHVLYNENINALGFGGDTMHMARLLDSSRDKASGGIGATGYSLEALTADILGSRKVPMKELFGVGKPLKNGTPSKVLVLPPIEDLQRGTVQSSHRNAFIKYSANDAESTWKLYQALDAGLEKTFWVQDEATGKSLTMRKYYDLLMVPFGETLTDMERRGIKVDTDYLAKIEALAKADKKQCELDFMQWVQDVAGPDAKYINPQSSSQLQVLLFGGAENSKIKDKPLPTTRVIKIELEPAEVAEYEEFEDALVAIKAHEEYDQFLNEEFVPELISSVKPHVVEEVESFEKEFKLLKVTELKVKCKEFNLPVSGKKADLIDRLVNHLNQDNKTDVASSSIEEVKVVPQEAVAPISDRYSAMTTQDLRDVVKVRSLPCASSNSRAELLEGIRGDDAYIMDLVRAHQGLPPLAPMKYPDKSVSSPPSSPTPPTPTTSPPAQFDPPKALHPPLPLEGLALDEKRMFELAQKYAHISGRRGAKRFREVTINSLGLVPTKVTTSGLPSVTSDVLRSLAGPPESLTDPASTQKGRAYRHFAGGEKGTKACIAMDAVCKMGSIDTMISSFIEPLQKLSDANSRVHCSLNLNTATGRLSSRRPNLQNQPALEKDQYKIRDAFCAQEGMELIVADYGQLELRLLAHMTNCKSMIKAFKDGGCFHSRTAVGMFEHVRKAVEDGSVLLEWDYSKGPPPKPLVKDVYGSERRKAKTLNFSIAYGKTAHGLSKDWGVSVPEAEKLLLAWYEDRPEVLEWQKNVIKEARRTGATRTLCGRYRKLNDINSRQRGPRGHSERGAINTPIQGGAADIVMLAMVKINQSPKLNELGFKLLLQIHDEVILEGPIEHVEEAMQEVVRCMEKPWDDSGLGVKELSVALDVDAKHARTWFEAK